MDCENDIFLLLFFNFFPKLKSVWLSYEESFFSALQNLEKDFIRNNWDISLCVIKNLSSHEIYLNTPLCVKEKPFILNKNIQGVLIFFICYKSTVYEHILKAFLSVKWFMCYKKFLEYINIRKEFKKKHSAIFVNISTKQRSFSQNDIHIKQYL